MPYQFDRYSRKDTIIFKDVYKKEVYTYDIEDHGTYFTVQLGGDEVVFDTARMAVAACRKDIANIMWEDAPEIAEDDRSLDAMIDFINSDVTRKEWFISYMTFSSGSYWVDSINEVLKSGSSKGFEEHDPEIKNYFIRICKKILEDDFTYPEYL